MDKASHKPQTYAGLASAAADLAGAQLSPGQLDAFRWYAAELAAWNRRINLTAITDPREIEIKHFLDSLTCLRAMKGEHTDRLIDVGTGAGFPGLALKIACPSLRVTLVESIGKKVDFCRHVIGALGLAGVEVVHQRAEIVGAHPAHRERYDWAVARAVAQLSVLVEYLLPLLRIGGCAIAQKGETGPAEVQEAEGALQVLGGHLDQLIPIELPGVAESRYLVVITKVAGTPGIYPRRVGIPSKRPLR